MVKISLQSISSKVITLDISPTTTFAEIEVMIKENDNFKGINYKFIYNGKLIDPTSTVQSINYTPSSFVIVAFQHEPSSKPIPFKEQPDSKEAMDEETIKKIEKLTSLGYDREEVIEALKKFDYDVDKAKNYIRYRLDSESNQKLVDLFNSNQNEALKIFQSYLEQTDPELAKKVADKPIPMLFMMGLVRKKRPEDDFESFPFIYD